MEPHQGCPARRSAQGVSGERSSGCAGVERDGRRAGPGSHVPGELPGEFSAVRNLVARPRVAALGGPGGGRGGHHGGGGCHGAHHGDPVGGKQSACGSPHHRYPEQLGPDEQREHRALLLPLPGPVCARRGLPCRCHWRRAGAGGRGGQLEHHRPSRRPGRTGTRRRSGGGERLARCLAGGGLRHASRHARAETDGGMQDAHVRLCSRRRSSRGGSPAPRRGEGGEW
mmetsp:Transcript_11429/g.30853  ORF Transcript_11429/g.30853 Transcript_11429/m.30853 type:complete len:227 (+) Transcript_11429:509-1189(+)